MMVLFRIEPAAALPSHHHRHEQYGVVIQGGGALEIKGTLWDVREGDSYYIPSGARHEFRNNLQKPTIIIDFFVPEREDYVDYAVMPDCPAKTRLKQNI